MNEVNHIQIDFFKKLKQQLSQETLAANEIASLLHISKSEAYNKISGKSQLTLNQLYIICQKFNLHFEIGQPGEMNSCSVRFTPFHSGKISVGDYIINLNKFLDDLALQHVRKLSCSTDDIPFFHLFKYPELAAFKMHFWESRMSGTGENKPEKIFDRKKIIKKDIENAFSIHKIYLDIPSVEIWTSSELLTIIAQLKYAHESRWINDAGLGKILCDQLLSVLTDVEGYAIQKSKSASASFDWYQCDVVGSVSYLADTADEQYCFLRFNTFNNFQTSDEKLCKEVEMWMRSLLNNSTGFSGHGSRQRNLYLDDAKKTIEQLRERFLKKISVTILCTYPIISLSKNQTSITIAQKPEIIFQGIVINLLPIISCKRCYQ